MSEPTPSADSSAPVPGPSAWRIFGIPAVLAVVGYVFFYACDAHWRLRRGPWEVTFLQEPDGAPALRIRQESLGISNVQVRFLTPSLGAWTNDLPKVVRFDDPEREVPFGELVFHDLMYQPGTIVLQCFGHEVQLLPRALFLDRRETPWKSDSRWVIDADSQFAETEHPPLGSPADRSSPSTR